MITTTPPPVPQHLESADYLQLAVFALAWMSAIAYLVFFIRRCVLHGDLLAEYERVIDESEAIDTFAAEYVPTAQQVARTERSLREKLETARDHR